MSAVPLRTALARLRQQAKGGTSGTRAPLGGGSTPAVAETQQPQGFGGAGTTGTSGTIENVAFRNFPPADPTETAALRSWWKSAVPLVPVVPGQQLRRFQAEPPADSAVVPLVPPSWTDLDSWCRRLGTAGLLEHRRVVLRDWIEAAGGWSDAAAVYLPSCLPNGLALATLRAHARALRREVREDPDDLEHLQWLRGAQ